MFEVEDGEGAEIGAANEICGAALSVRDGKTGGGVPDVPTAEPSAGASTGGATVGFADGKEAGVNAVGGTTADASDTDGRPNAGFLAAGAADGVNDGTLVGVTADAPKEIGVEVANGERGGREDAAGADGVARSGVGVAVIGSMLFANVDEVVGVDGIEGVEGGGGTKRLGRGSRSPVIGPCEKASWMSAGGFAKREVLEPQALRLRSGWSFRAARSARLRMAPDRSA